MAVKKSKPKRISYYKKPEKLSLEQYQIALRKQFGQENTFQIENIGGSFVFSDYQVLNPATGNSYKVSIRSKERERNFCECLDFKTNHLGICKHISAVFANIEKQRGAKKLLKQGMPPQKYTSVYLDYLEGRDIKIRRGTSISEPFQKIVRRYFDENNRLLEGAYSSFDKFLEEVKNQNEEFVCYPDALSFVLEKRDEYRRKERVLEFFKSKDSESEIEKLLKVPLFPYQKRGLQFATIAGKALIADEMGLGKTIQAIATAELNKKLFGISKVLVVCPTSLKYQWKTEIEKFTYSSSMVIEGSWAKRQEIYETCTDFYQIVSYNTLVNDLKKLQSIDIDMVILDEAQRIKNWKTKVSHKLKQLDAPYKVVLTGTPIENKLEELYSIIQFLDVYRMGPLYKLIDRHLIVDGETQKMMGYRNLHEISDKLKDIIIRRKKSEVLKDLPERTIKTLFVPMTTAQGNVHEEYEAVVAKLVLRWQRMGFLNEKDRQRLMISLNMMRMACDSTFILDQKTRHDTKIEEVMNILNEALDGSETKVVIFSQWERMTRLVAQELSDREITFEYLHGGIESSKRKDLLSNFANKPESRVFLSTDAGGVGLNLQSASILINLDIPWNPAVLEQRIARIHRMGQKQNVTIINMVSTGTIEHRMLGVLNFKSTLAQGVLDGGEDTIVMSEDRFKAFMKTVESVTSEDIIATIQPEDTADIEFESKTEEETKTFEGDEDINENKAAGVNKSPVVGSDLISNGINFFNQLAQTLQSPEATKELVSSITEKDANGKSYLKIPIESQQVVQNVLQGFATLLSNIGKP